MKKVFLGFLFFTVASATYSCTGDSTSIFWAWFFYVFCHYIPIILIASYFIYNCKNEYVTFLSKASLSYSISCSFVLTASYIIGTYNQSVYKPTVGILTAVILVLTMIPSLRLCKKKMKG